MKKTKEEIKEEILKPMIVRFWSIEYILVEDAHRAMDAWGQQCLNDFKKELLEKMPTKEMIEAESSETNLKDGRLYDSWEYAFDDEQQDAFDTGANWFRDQMINLLK